MKSSVLKASKTEANALWEQLSKATNKAGMQIF